ncbi:MAG: hypothetical protein ACTSWY_06215 [Promethearchaeota archaeon]
MGSGKKILKKIKLFNELMDSAIVGPNCTDPNICHSDCCHIMIDIPEVLAQYYIDIGVASEDSFVRGDVFSFKISVNTKSSKCVFFDREINGCLLHKTKMKPPQCWIYPTGFLLRKPSESMDNTTKLLSKFNGKKFTEDETVKCKRASGWKITDEEKTQEASKIFEEYIKFSKKEFLESNSRKNIISRLNNFQEKLLKLPPSSIAGLKDGWNEYIPLSAEGISLKLKNICEKVCRKKDSGKINYFQCDRICKEVAHKISQNLPNEVLHYIKKNGPKETYAFYEIWDRNGQTPT